MPIEYPTRAWNIHNRMSKTVCQLKVQWLVKRKFTWPQKNSETTVVLLHWTIRQGKAISYWKVLTSIFALSNSSRQNFFLKQCGSAFVLYFLGVTLMMDWNRAMCRHSWQLLGYANIALFWNSIIYIRKTIELSCSRSLF